MTYPEIFYIHFRLRTNYIVAYDSTRINFVVFFIFEVSVVMMVFKRGEKKIGF